MSVCLGAWKWIFMFHHILRRNLVKCVPYISREDIGEYMQSYAEENKVMAQLRCCLNGSLKGEKILLATPLLKWYLEHGLKVTKVYQVIEFTPKPCFKQFGDAVSDARRAGDADPTKSIIADTMKLVSFFFHLGKHGVGTISITRIEIHIFFLSGGEFGVRKNHY